MKSVDDETLSASKVSTALDVAAKEGHIDIIKNLQRYHLVDPKVCRLAAQQGHLPLVKYLFSVLQETYGNVQTTTTNATMSAVHLALMNNHFDVVRYLCRVSVQQELVTLVMHLVTVRNLPSLENLYDCAARPDFFESIVDHRGYTPLLQAAHMGSLPILHFFLDFGKVRVHATNNMGNSAVATAAKYNQHDAVKMLVQKGGASLDDLVHEEGPSPLSVFFHTVVYTEQTLKWMCLETGGLERLKSLDPYGNTVFHYVVHSRNLGMAQWVANLVGDAVPRSGNINDMSPLMYALENQDLPMVKWLLSSGHAHRDDIVIANTGETAIFAAARHNRTAIFIALVDQTSPDLDKKNNEGQTVWDMFTWSQLTQEESHKVLSTLLSRLAPPDHVVGHLVGDHRRLLSESRKLRELIGPFLADRRATLMKLENRRIPGKGQRQQPVLPSAVIKRILSFDSDGFTTDQMWATKLGDPKVKRTLDL
jgi:ankyrin repeat protein